MTQAAWPELPYKAWKDTYATLHMWTQIAGKIRLAQTPWLNHSWHVVLYVSPRGLTTSPIPYGNRSFELRFRLHRPCAGGIDRATARRGASVSFPARSPISMPNSWRRWPSSASRSASTTCPTSCLSRSASARIAPTLPTIPTSPSAIGELLATVEQVMFQIPHRLHRQKQPGSFLLGQLRSGGHALLGAARATASRRRAASARRRGAGGLFA